MLFSILTVAHIGLLVRSRMMWMSVTVVGGICKSIRPSHTPFRLLIPITQRRSSDGSDASKVHRMLLRLTPSSCSKSGELRVGSLALGALRVEVGSLIGGTKVLFSHLVSFQPLSMPPWGCSSVCAGSSFRGCAPACTSCSSAPPTWLPLSFKVGYSPCHVSTNRD